MHVCTCCISNVHVCAHVDVFCTLMSVCYVDCCCVLAYSLQSAFSASFQLRQRSTSQIVTQVPRPTYSLLPLPLPLHRPPISHYPLSCPDQCPHLRTVYSCQQVLLHQFSMFHLARLRIPLPARLRIPLPAHLRVPLDPPQQHLGLLRLRPPMGRRLCQGRFPGCHRRTI